MPGIFDDDTLYSAPVTGYPDIPAVDTALLTAPSSNGLGFSDADNYEPLMANGLQAQRAPARLDLPTSGSPSRKDAVPMSGLDRFFAALGEFGAGVQGKPSPMAARIKQQREDRLADATELRAHMDALDSGVKLVRSLTGAPRKAAAAQYAGTLNQIKPGLGDAFSAMADQPDGGAEIMEYAKDIPELAAAVKVGGIEAAAKILASPEGMKMVQTRIDGKRMPLLIQKGQSMIANWQQLVPDMPIDSDGDGRVSASEILKANDWLQKNKPDIAKVVGFNDSDLERIGRNEDGFYGALGVLTPKDEREVIRKHAEVKAQGNKIEWIGMPGGQKQQAAIDPKGNIVKMIGSPIDAHAPASTQNNYSTSLVAGVDAEGRPVFVQPARDGGTPKPVAGVFPPERAADAAARRRGEEGQATAASIDRQITELASIINTSEGKVFGTTGLKGLAGRVKETATGLANPDADTPALDVVNRKELLVANLRKTMADSNMSKADKDALETAIGGIESSWGTKASTLRGLKNLQGFVRDKFAAKGGSVARPKSQAEFDALAPGSEYIDPDDGKRYKKPKK